MMLYTFFRKDSFYPLELKDDAEAIANAVKNPGTLKVENEVTHETIWEADPMTVNRCVNCGKIELHKADNQIVWKLPPSCFRESERVTFNRTVCPECAGKQVAFAI